MTANWAVRRLSDCVYPWPTGASPQSVAVCHLACASLLNVLPLGSLTECSLGCKRCEEKLRHPAQWPLTPASHHRPPALATAFRNCFNHRLLHTPQPPSIQRCMHTTKLSNLILQATACITRPPAAAAATAHTHCAPAAAAAAVPPFSTSVNAKMADSSRSERPAAPADSRRCTLITCGVRTWERGSEQSEGQTG